MKNVEIYAALRRELSNRKFSAGDRFHSEPELAKRFNAARGTVRQALARLQQEGLINRRGGAGTFVTRCGGRKSGLVGLLIPDLASARFFCQLKDSLESCARAAGYEVVTETVLDDGTQAQIVASVRTAARRLAVRRVEGVIFRPHVDRKCEDGNREILRLFRRTDVPVVLVDSDITQPPERSTCDLVAVDNVSAGRRVAAHLAECGRGRIAFLMKGETLGPNANWENRLFGLAGELAVIGVDSGVRKICFAPDDTRALKALFRSRQAPDAVVCGNDETAVALVGALKSIGLRVPEDVAVTGFDDDSCARACVPPLTTVHQPVALLARTAIRVLLARIRNPQSAPREILLNAPLVVRRSST